MNVNQYQKYHKNTRNMKKGILASNIGALPILQECPCCQGENFAFALEILDQLIDALSDENESES